MSLCTRTCVLLTVLWIIWLVGTCHCSSGTSIPIKMLALRYLTRLDGWYMVWELPFEGDAVEEHVGEVPRLLVPNILLWSTGNSLPVPKGS